MGGKREVSKLGEFQIPKFELALSCPLVAHLFNALSPCYSFPLQEKVVVKSEFHGEVIPPSALYGPVWNAHPKLFPLEDPLRTYVRKTKSPYPAPIPTSPFPLYPSHRQQKLFPRRKFWLGKIVSIPRMGRLSKLFSLEDIRKKGQKRPDAPPLHLALSLSRAGKSLLPPAPSPPSLLTPPRRRQKPSPAPSVASFLGLRLLPSRPPPSLPPCFTPLMYRQKRPPARPHLPPRFFPISAQRKALFSLGNFG